VKLQTVLWISLFSALGCASSTTEFTHESDSTAPLSVAKDLAGEGRDDHIDLRRLRSDFSRVVLSNDRTWWVGSETPEVLSLGEEFTMRIGIVPNGDDLGVDSLQQIPEDLSDLTIHVDCTMPQHGHGMNLVPEIEATQPGRFLVHGLELFMEGQWLVTVDVEFGQHLERTQWWVEPR